MLRYLTVYTISEAICFLVAVFTLSKDKDRAWRYFPAYLLTILATELFSIYLKTHGIKRTTELYSILTLYEISFMAILFRSIFVKYVKNWTVFNVFLLLILCLYAYDTYDHGVNVRYNLTNSVLGVLILIGSLSYLNLLLKDETYIKLGNDPNFWWVVGTLLFYYGFTSLNVLYDLLKDSYTKPGIFFSNTFKILNIIYYSIWSYTFICRKWNQKS